MKKIYIVTGANGFLGNNLVRALVRNPENEVRALVTSREHADDLRGLNCQIYVGDVTKPASLTEIFEVPAAAKVYVIHCAAIVYIKSRPNPEVYNVNVNGTRNVLRECLRVGAKLIYINSVHAIPEQPNGGLMTEIAEFDPDKVEGEYAKSKAMAANYVLDAVREQGLDACIIQPSGIIGPYDFKVSHLTQLIIDTAEGRLWAGVKGGYDFVDVRDVVAGVLAACDKGRPGECYILSGRYVAVPDLLAMITTATEQKPIKTFLPMWLARLAAPVAEFYYRLKKQPPLYTKYSLYALGSNANFSHAKADRELGYQVRPVEETIADTVAWLKSAGKIK